jgi:integrase
MASITTASARAKLAVRRAPYFVELVRGELALGYRKNRGAGAWVARRYLEKRQRLGDGTWTKARYAIRNIGPADDGLKGTIDFDRAEARARLWLRLGAATSSAKSITVKDAVLAYIERREAQERAQRGEGRLPGGIGLKLDARARLGRHVLADARLSGTPLEHLAREDLAQWRASLAGKAARGRGRALSDASIRRTASDLRAALNFAHEANHGRLLAEFALVIRHGLKAQEAAAPAPRQAQVLTDADVRRILEATADIDAAGNWGGDLVRLIAVMAASGARFSQVIRMTVADVQVAQSRLMVPVSHKGRGAKAIAHTAIRVGPDVIDALRPALAGRKGHEPLLLRPRWKQVGLAKWERVGRAPWQFSSDLLRPWALILARAELPADVVPYALRHSSIVRGLRAGLPLRLVAALHDTSSEMVERHYAAFIVDAMDELAARAVVPLITAAPIPLAKVVS